MKPMQLQALRQKTQVLEELGEKVLEALLPPPMPHATISASTG